MMQLYQFQKEVIQIKYVEKYKISYRDRILTLGEVMVLWQNNIDFRIFYSDILARSDFAAFFWELPVITPNTLCKPFEFVLVNSKPLANIQVDKQPFTDHFRRDLAVVSFANLGKNAILVVPCPEPETDVQCYSHLATFVRGAGDSQKAALWQKVGETVRQRLGEKPFWLSTSGLGVFWLHIRLDDIPKYYNYMPYKAYQE